MSTEKIISELPNNLSPLVTSEKTEEAQSTRRVDINILLNRARKIKEKQTRTNLVFLGLALSLFFVVGVILSF